MFWISTSESYHSTCQETSGHCMMASKRISPKKYIYGALVLKSVQCRKFVGVSELQRDNIIIIDIVMASASFLKSSPVLDKSEFVKGQTLLRQHSVSVRCQPSALSVRASYADELVKTAVCLCFHRFLDIVAL